MSFSKEQRAHDLATSLLPHVIKESKWAYYEYDDNGTGHFNPEIIEEYNLMYDYFLKEFEYYDEAKF